MALDELFDEHEQGERVRAWLRRNGVGIIAGIVLGLGLIGGFRWWQGEAQAGRVAAGDDYRELTTLVEAGRLDEAAAGTRPLADGPYAVLAALRLARAQLEAGKRDDAIATLRAVPRDDDSVLGGVVEQRLARLLIDAGKGADAAGLLDGVDDAVGLEVLGDARAALGERDAARAAYERALALLDVAAPQRALLELKLIDAGGKPAKTENRS